MGCLLSKKEAVDLHPNVFRVVNIDENGADLCSGQLEITDSDIILYREGRDSTIWPLHSLRRYGFEQDMFSFESGRRCETGEGIYAFRCRRAAVLFQNLQQQIQLRNVMNDPAAYPVTRLTNSPSPRGRQTLQASVVHRSSIDNGRPDVVSQNNNQPPLAPRPIISQSVSQSPRSPSSADILEVMPLYPRSQTSSNNHVSNVYQLNDFKRNHNNNQSELNTPIYINDFIRDLTALRNSLKQEAAFNTIRDIEEESRFLESRYVNETVPKNTNLVSPTLSNSTEHYSQLDTAQTDNPRLYMNIALSEALLDINKNDPTPATPMTPKQVEYCNVNMSGKPDIINTYANFSLGDVIDTKTTQSSEAHHKFSESDTITSMSPVEELEVTYVVLDIETKDNAKANRELASPENQSYNSSKTESLASSSSHIKGKFVSQTSLEKPSTLSTPNAPAGIGYTTIDFEKTVALTSVASNTDIDSGGSRKTRHNSVNIVFGSPSIADKKLHLNN